MIKPADVLPQMTTIGVLSPLQASVNTKSKPKDWSLEDSFVTLSAVTARQQTKYNLGHGKSCFDPVRPMLSAPAAGCSGLKSFDSEARQEEVPLPKRDLAVCRCVPSRLPTYLSP